jgi:predicted methyltransferase
MHGARQPMTAEESRVVGEVAAAVGLAEGEAGVRDVLRAVARREPVAVRMLSRATELPVPIVSAVCNELRRHGIIEREPPVRLSCHGHELFGRAGGRVPFEPACPTCAGLGFAVPRLLDGVAAELSVLAEAAPRARLELDQSHCTVETKVRRVLALDDAGALDGKRILLLGDDDLTSVAIDLTARRLARSAGIRSVVVVDVDPALVSFLRRTLRQAPFSFEAIVHDLREPLPEHLCAGADVVITDPPYTVEGAELFLSRAAQATGQPGRDVFLAFGARRPDELLRLQRSILAMGFTVRRLLRNFNEYLGAGVLGGTSHLYQLATTSEVRGLVDGLYDGQLYTGDFRQPVRSYRCKQCGCVEQVGRGETWASIGALKRARCPRCRGKTFVPLSRGPQAGAAA